MRVHCVSSRQQLTEHFRPQRDGARKSDARPHGETAAYPVPNREKVRFRQIHLLGGVPFGGHHDHVMVAVLAGNPGVQQPLIHRRGVNHGFAGTETLGRHDDERLKGIESAYDAVKKNAVRRR